MIKTVVYLDKPYKPEPIVEEKPLFKLIAPNGDVYETRFQLGSMKEWLEASCQVVVEKTTENRNGRKSDELKINGIPVRFGKGNRRIILYPKDKPEASLWYNSFIKKALEVAGVKKVRITCTPLVEGESKPCLEGTILGYKSP